jgi:hypothetical protein
VEGCGIRDELIGFDVICTIPVHPPTIESCSNSPPSGPSFLRVLPLHSITRIRSSSSTRDEIRFGQHNLVSIATVIVALSFGVFIVWFFHKIFPEKPSTTAMASSVTSLIFIVLIGYGLNNLFGLKRDRDSRVFGLQQQHLSQLRPVLKLESDRLQDIAEIYWLGGSFFGQNAL